MKIDTTRFGPVIVEPDDVLHFAEGLLGLEDCRDWVLLADAETDALAWMQSLGRPEVALAVVNPRRFVPGYQLRVARRELEPIELKDPRTGRVLVIMSSTGPTLTLNLKAPLVIHLERRLGRQVIANGRLPIQFQLPGGPTTLRKIA